MEPSFDDPLSPRPAELPPSPAAAPPGPWRAVGEMLLCSGVPTQLVIGQLLVLVGVPVRAADGSFTAAALFTLVMTDTIVVLVLIAVLLHASRERMRDVVIGPRTPPREAALGLALVPVLFIGVGVTVLTIRRLLPWTHNVAANPFQEVMRTPGEAGLFAIVAIVAGGLREEVQRAFLLHRFAGALGRPLLGLLVVSIAFGAGHMSQGWDAAIATGLLGLTWGVVYFARQSAVAPIVSHAGYNAAEILQAVVLQGLAL